MRMKMNEHRIIRTRFRRGIFGLFVWSSKINPTPPKVNIKAAARPSIIYCPLIRQAMKATGLCRPYSSVVLPEEESETNKWLCFRLLVKPKSSQLTNTWWFNDNIVDNTGSDKEVWNEQAKQDTRETSIHSIFIFIQKSTRNHAVRWTYVIVDGFFIHEGFFNFKFGHWTTLNGSRYKLSMALEFHVSNLEWIGSIIFFSRFGFELQSQLHFLLLKLSSPKIKTPIEDDDLAFV